VIQCETGRECPDWTLGEWGECSLRCGGGSHTRAVDCVEGGMASLDCPTPVPEKERACNVDECPVVFWQTSAYDCDAACEQEGTATRDVFCSDAAGETVEDAQCTESDGLKPDVTKACSGGTCPTWAVGGWTKCPQICPGDQVRSVECVLSGETLDDAECATVGDKPADLQACAGDTITVCTDTGHAYCDVDGECQCNRGYISSANGLCDSSVEASAVMVPEAASYPTGIPPGEQITLTWTWGGGASDDLPVTISLCPEAVSTCTRMTTSLGSAESILVNLPSSYQPGNAVIQVRTSVDKVASSATFAVATPCAYVDCGFYGQCNAISGQCDCPASNGYSGESCEVAPCSYNFGDMLTSCLNDGVCEGAAPDYDFACTCPDQWTGKDCAAQAACTLDCNGANGQADADCAKCNCDPTSFWTGDSCETCTLECENGGAPDASCSTCVCEGYFIGEHCECAYYDMYVEANGLGSATDVEKIVFEENFRIFSVLSLQEGAFGAVVKQIDEGAVPGVWTGSDVLVNVKAGSCPIAEAEMRRLRRRNLLQEGGLLDLGEETMRQLADKNSPLRNGEFTIDEDSFRVATFAPTATPLDLVPADCSTWNELKKACEVENCLGDNLPTVADVKSLCQDWVDFEELAEEVADYAIDAIESCFVLETPSSEVTDSITTYCGKIISGEITEDDIAGILDKFNAAGQLAPSVVFTTLAMFSALLTFF